MNNNKLWYTAEASCWTQSLPLGNGRIGAMVFGGVQRERLALNEDSLWSGYVSNDKTLDSAYEGYQKARELVLDEKYVEAGELIENSVLGQYNDSYMPLGDLFLSFDTIGPVTQYVRDLDISSNVACVSYEQAENKIFREYFISEPDQVMVVRITSGSNAISLSANFECQMKHNLYKEQDILFLEGLCPSRVEPNYMECENPIVYTDEPEKIGIRFAAGIKISETDGEVILTDSVLSVKNASFVTIIFSAFSNYNGFDNIPEINGKEFKSRLIHQLNEKSKISYDTLKNTHVSDFANLYNRVKVNFDCPNKENVPTDKRLLDFQDDKSDIGMYELMFNYGRFLTIAGSRKGTQPLNLQGIWNEHLRAPWSSNYTININTEMNYWPTLVGNLSECYEPLINLIKDISISGRATAKKQYHARGFTAHHNIDLWRNTNSVGGKVKGAAVYGFWPVGAGWLCSHVFEYYSFTMDENYLKKTAFPLLKGCAEFYLDVLTEYDGYFMICPSTSPENNYIKDGEICSVSKTTTMTTAIIKEVFQNFLKTCDLLHINDENYIAVKNALSKLPPFKIGSKGQLLEWYDEETESDQNHRHISHLYPFHPSNLITQNKTPDLVEAVKKSLEFRGDDGSGWGLGWKINQWARLKDGNHAVILMNNQLRTVPENEGIDYLGRKGGTYTNLFDAHPPFQIDGNFAFTAGLMEMLMQSHDEGIEILPALPDNLISGSVSGLCARGNVTVDFSWENYALKVLTLHSSVEKEVCIRYKDKKIIIQIGKNTPIVF